MALAATGSLELTEEVYNATGKELKLLGYDWVFSPVADVNSNYKNPVIGEGSFSRLLPGLIREDRSQVVW
jgi:beta-N-acetylhexosaminidase